jgi:hypothetical protein
MVPQNNDNLAEMLVAELLVIPSKIEQTRPCKRALFGVGWRFALLRIDELGERFPRKLTEHIVKSRNVHFDPRPRRICVKNDRPSGRFSDDIRPTTCQKSKWRVTSREVRVKTPIKEPSNIAGLKGVVSREIILTLTSMWTNIDSHLVNGAATPKPGIRLMQAEMTHSSLNDKL